MNLESLFIVMGSVNVQLYGILWGIELFEKNGIISYDNVPVCRF